MQGENLELMGSIIVFPALHVSHWNPYVRDGRGSRSWKQTWQRGCFVEVWEDVQGLYPGAVTSLSWNLRFCMHFIFKWTSQLSLVQLESEKLCLITTLMCVCFSQNTFITTIAAATPTKKTFFPSSLPNTVAW